MTHAWLLTGPPGSGRSTAARAFAAALQCPTGGCGECHECRTALAGSHPDVTLVATEHVFLRLEDVRPLVTIAQQRPSLGRWRVIVVEDADRLNDTSGNLLLKAAEDPPPRTAGRAPRARCGCSARRAPTTCSSPSVPAAGTSGCASPRCGTSPTCSSAGT